MGRESPVTLSERVAGLVAVEALGARVYLGRRCGRGGHGRCGGARRVLHEGRVLLADSRVHFTNVRGSVLSHDF